jgi:hypothetical protein
MVQTVYNQYNPEGFAGLLDGVGTHSVRSYAAEEIIPVGSPVRLGTTPAKEVLKANAGATVVGFALHDHAREQTSAGAVEYKATETVSVLTAGRLWVETDDAVAAGAIARLKTSNNKLTDEAATTGIENFSIISVRFLTATTGAGLALVEVK